MDYKLNFFYISVLVLALITSPLSFSGLESDIKYDSIYNVSEPVGFAFAQESEEETEDESEEDQEEVAAAEAGRKGPGRRGQPGQPEGRDPHAHEHGLPRGPGRGRPGSRRRGQQDRLRPGPDGHADAQHGRPDGHGHDPRTPRRRAPRFFAVYRSPVPGAFRASG